MGFTARRETDRLRIKNWEKFQHYKHRNPPWIRLYVEILDDFDFMTLPVASKALLPQLWLLASRELDGMIKMNAEHMAFRLRMTASEVEEALKPLVTKGFVEIAVDANTGDVSVLAPTVTVASNMLATCEQHATTETETETDSETDTETLATLIPVAISINGTDARIEAIIAAHPNPENSQRVETAVMGAIERITKRNADSNFEGASDWLLSRTKVYADKTRHWKDPTKIMGAYNWFAFNKFDQNEKFWERKDGNSTQSALESIAERYGIKTVRPAEPNSQRVSGTEAGVRQD